MECHCPECRAPLYESEEIEVCPKCGCRVAGGNHEGAESIEVEQELLRDLREAFQPVHDARSSEQHHCAGAASPSPPGVQSGASSTLSSVSRFPGVGVRLGEFEILGEIGRGGMGIVFRARQPSLKRDVALKVLLGGSRQFRRSVERFRTEARVIARLNHPNIVPLFGDGESEGNLYYAMALIDGCSLDVTMQQYPELLSSSAIERRTAFRRLSASTGVAGVAPPPPTPRPKGHGSPDSEDTTPLAFCVPPPRTPADYRHLARLVAEIADGLSHAHTLGVIHRDIKPQNLLVSNEGRLYLSDFGLSQLVDEPHLTLTGEVMGTPAYLSPEQIMGGGKFVDHRTDIYSLGVTLYELLTARRPFHGEPREQLIHRICHTEPVAPRKIDRRVPRDLETICLRAMEKEPARRYGTAAAMAEDLRRFAQGLPICSQPPGVARKSWLWIRRHKAVTTVLTLLLASAALGGGLATSIRSSRQAEANRLLTSSYDQLVYYDYRTPETVLDAVERAEPLRPDPVLRQVVRALVDAGRSDNVGAIGRLKGVLAEQPDDLRAMYLLAWLSVRNGQRAEAHRILEEADALGGPAAADEWFFRGLAYHFDRPDLAIPSYKQANALRAAQRKFFPQAILHLARAYNQRMYTKRTDDVFPDAEAILGQLIDQGHYGTYPYYLLSITQRLAGEIDLVRGDQTLAEEQFRAALEWAVLGQELDPSDDRPITAEAECLERLGLIPEAVDARTRAIAAANQEPKRCEGYHYRWRLHYWLDQLDAASADVKAHAVCMPDSMFYAHVYPCWLAAEARDFDAAIGHAYALVDASPTDPQARLWAAACLRLLGRLGEADAILAVSQEDLDFSTGLVPPQSVRWMRALYAMAAGQASLTDALNEAQDVEEARKLQAEAYFHAGMQALGTGDRLQAGRLLRDAYLSFDSELRYTFHARALLVKMERDPQWPSWLGMQVPRAKHLPRPGDNR